MKKTLYLLLSLLLTITVLTSCDSLTSIFGDFSSVTTEAEVTTTEPEVTTPEPEVTTPEPEVTTPEPEVTTPEPEVTTPEPEVTTPEPEVTTPEPEVTTPEPDVNPDEPLYTDFTAEEKELFNNTVGLVIPFIPNSEYYVEEYEISGTNWLRFYTKGNTQAEFEAYLELFSSYNFIGTTDNENGNTWYLYSNGDVYVDLTYHYFVTDYIVDVFVRIPSEDDDVIEHIYNGFNIHEEEFFNSTVGFVIPFIPNDNYYVEEANIPESKGVNFYTVGNTQSEFWAYLNLFSAYTFDGIYTNANNDVWYLFSNGDVCIEVSYYHYEDNYIVDVYVYIPNENEDEDGTEHLYSDFTAEEKALFNDTVGLVIPFIPNSEYYVEEYAILDGRGVNFYTYGNTQIEFEFFLARFTSYNFDGTVVDEVGDTWYLYSNGNVCVDISYYIYDGEYIVDVYVYIEDEDEGEDVPEHLYSDFTADEKALFNDTVGLVIPFIPNDEYCVEPYDDASGEPCVRFYTIGNTQAEFEAYLELFSIYSYEESKIDEYGDTWYFYSSGDVRIAVTYFYYQDAYRVETFTYISESSDETEHLYTDFTEEEKTLFNDLVGLVIPFVPNDEYYVEEYAFEDEIGINFYAFGNTQAEFDAYRSLFSSYSYDGSENDEYGDAWYYYSTGDVCVDMTFYYYEGNYVVDVYVYIMNEDGDEDVTDHLYNDFTAEEKALFNDTVGLVIPFVPNDEYHVGETEIAGGRGINFYTFGNTQAEFEAYLDLFSSYNYDGTQEDDYGYTWYFFSKNNVFVDVTYYLYEDSYVIEVFVYVLNENVTEHLYTDFTEEEKALFNNVVGILVPFIPNDQYVVEKYNRFGDNCVHFITVGNTQEEYEAYLELFSSYNYDGTRVDEYRDTWQLYSTGNIYIDVTYYFYNENYILDLYVYIMASGEDTEPSDFLYTDFTEEEKELFNEIVGFVVPFLPNDQYFVKNYQSWNEIGIVFYTLGNTESDFNNYLPILNSTYTFVNTTIDDSDGIWYNYSNGEASISLTHYMYEGVSYSVIEVYLVTSDWTEEEWDDPSIELLPNDGKGLPEDADGVYDVDFTESEYVQDVSDQKYYSDGCPTTGSPAVLVIPVEFSDITAQSKGYTIDKLEQIFYGNDLSYYSLYEYFRISSQNQLTLDITVVDAWFRPANSSSYYKEMSASHPNENEQELGTQLILDEALAYLATFMDLSKFDSDNNGYIDAVVLVYTAEIDNSDNFHWAYRYWNWYKDESGAPYKYDDVSANDYVWISYEFMFEAYDENGYLVFDQSNPLNPYTFIHEFSHILGAEDYYDTSGETTVLGGLDIMDGTTGDHNPYTKFNYGWITTSKLIVTDSTLTINLEAFAKNGDTIILANNWDETLGAYQEYYIIMYYTMTGLNAGDGGYFDQNAILVYHINSTLQVKYDEQKSPYIVHNSNTSVGPQSTRNNLIEYVISGDDDRLYTVGETLPTTTDDSGNELIYTFIVDAITEEYATITFTKK